MPLLPSSHFLTPPTEKVCPSCKKTFISTHRRQIYCCKQHKKNAWSHRDYFKDVEKSRVKSLAQYHKNPEPSIIKLRQRRADLRELWGKSQRGGHYDEYHHAEELAVKYILPNEGFTDILWVNADWESTFPGDVLAKRDGQVYCINATLSYAKRVSRRTLRIFAYLGVKYLLVHVKPDLTKYYIQEVCEKNNIVRKKKGSVIRAEIYSKHIMQNKLKDIIPIIAAP